VIAEKRANQACEEGIKQALEAREAASKIARDAYQKSRDEAEKVAEEAISKIREETVGQAWAIYSKVLR